MMSAVFSTANVPTTGQSEQRALPGRLQSTGGCRIAHSYPIQSACGAVRTCEVPYRATSGSSSVAQYTIWDNRASRHSERPGAAYATFSYGRQLHGVAAGSACTCGEIGCKRWYAAPAEKPSPPKPNGIEKEPLVPYDPDENSASGPGLAPFIPPSIEKLINVIMRHGKKEVARRIVFDASHALYNATRRPNPRPELRQRKPEFVPK